MQSWGYTTAVMQLLRAVGEDRAVASASEVADYVAAMASELADMARRAGLDALANALEQTHRVAAATLARHQDGNAAPDDAA